MCYESDFVRPNAAIYVPLERNPIMDGSQITLDDLSNAPDLETLTSHLAAKDMTPGWINRETPLLWREPKSAYNTAHWRYAECKAAMDGAAKLIDTELAERRNLVLRNPIEGNDFATTRTLVNAYQTILPGEEARSHRHAPHALRVILDSKGAWSVVNGEKHPMETGDIVLTPGMSWHGHGHDGEEQAYWMDGLDVPLVHLMEPMFVEDHPDGMEPIERVTPDSPYRFTWEQTVPDNEGFFGRRIVLDTSTMPTIGVYMQQLDSGFRTRPYRSTANVVYCPMQGSGTSVIDGETIDWNYGDTFAVPCWKTVEHHASEDSVLFSMTDEPVMRFCKYWQFEARD
jgi:gentisate 1,2-dioxygenase